MNRRKFLDILSKVYYVSKDITEFDGDMSLKFYIYPFLFALIDGTEEKFENYVERDRIVFRKSKWDSLVRFMKKRLGEIVGDWIKENEHGEIFMTVVVYGAFVGKDDRQSSVDLVFHVCGREVDVYKLQKI